jgi:hypothetical protein
MVLSVHLLRNNQSLERGWSCLCTCYVIISHWNGAQVLMDKIARAPNFYFYHRILAVVPNLNYIILTPCLKDRSVHYDLLPKTLVMNTPTNNLWGQRVLAFSDIKLLPPYEMCQLVRSERAGIVRYLAPPTTCKVREGWHCQISSSSHLMKCANL